MTDSVLEISNLAVTFDTPDGEVEAVKGVSFSIAQGECLGIVGESGSGKSQTFLSAFGLTSDNARVSGSVKFQGREVLGMTRRELDTFRGRHVAFVFQDPLTALTPHLTIEAQMGEVLAHHFQVRGAAARERAMEWLERVRIPEAARRLAQYPHELSGGMRQRVLIAAAFAAEPRLIVADEPTTALDVTVQKQILDLLASLATERKMATILVSHDLGAVEGRSDKVSVMYAGRIVERARTHDLFTQPHHPYSEALIASVPILSAAPHSTLRTIEGSPPDMANPPAGCRFAPRCTRAQDRCRVDSPELTMHPGGREFACHFPVGTTVTQEAGV